MYNIYYEYYHRVKKGPRKGRVRKLKQFSFDQRLRARRYTALMNDIMQSDFTLLSGD